MIYKIIEYYFLEQKIWAEKIFPLKICEEKIFFSEQILRGKIFSVNLKLEWFSESINVIFIIFKYT